MDGTLLAPSGAIPEHFWHTLDRARAAGITVAPASGRQPVSYTHLTLPTKA